MLENLQEEIRIFKKNESTYYDMLALANYLRSISQIDLTASVLIEKVIKDLEDSEVHIPYKFENINNYYGDVLREEAKQIRLKYNGIKECDNELDKFYMNANGEFINYNTSMPFNLVDSISRFKNYGLYNEFVVSNISLDKRLEMFGEFIKFNNCDIEEIIKNNGLYFSIVSPEVVKSKKEELLKLFSRGQCKSYNMQHLFLDLLNEDKIYMINELQGDVFDFNRLRFKVNNTSDSNLKISSSAVLCDNFGRLKSFEKLYNSESYFKYNKDICDNDAIIILKFIALKDIPKFIKLLPGEFKYTNVLIERINKLEDLDCWEYLRNDIANAIISKSKNRVEYKKNLKYSNLFLEETDIKKKRRELSTILYKMNDETLESVPTRKLVKDMEL